MVSVGKLTSTSHFFPGGRWISIASGARLRYTHVSCFRQYRTYRIMPSVLKATNHEFRAQQRGRVGQLIQRQEEIRAQLVQDPLLDLGTVRSVLQCSYGKLNRLLSDGKLAYWQAVPFSERKVRQSTLTAYLAKGDQRPQVTP
jgi:hypothetical protein